MSQVPDNFRAWASINLSALERNLRSIRMALPGHLRYISVVKANAYGHGLAPVVTRLMRSEADAFAVANLEEAERLREVGTGWPILVLSALLPGEYREAVRLGVHPIISSIEEVEGFAAASGGLDRSLGIHLKIDTGMGRLGVWHTEFEHLLDHLDKYPQLKLRGLCTHFSSADSDPEFTALQRQRFMDCLNRLKRPLEEGTYIHADNSAGVETFPEGGLFNAARIGLLQFGVRPRPGSLLDCTLTEPVLSFHARVGLVKDLPVGTPVSYGQTCRLKRPATVAVLTAGYADGLPTRLSNRGEVLLGGRRCPILGRVTMDQTIVDVTGLRERPRAGQVATFIGTEGDATITVSDFAHWSGQIEWEAFCSISSRTRRIYRSDTAI